MFEKEAEEFKKITQQRYLEMQRDGGNPSLWANLDNIWKAGAEFGYSKANELHYVNWKYFADKDYPESESALYLVQLRNRDILICEWEAEDGFGCFWDNNLKPIDNDDVYSWKEIVLPKE